MVSEPRVYTRRFTPADAPALVILLQAYMQETYQDLWHSSEEALRQDARGQRCILHLALTREEQPIGFLAWTPSYDLHHCVSGAEVLDLYVVPERRGRGVALLLGCATAEISCCGGRYMKGTVVESGSARQLYTRFGACDASGCIISGRAFRRLAELAGCSVREISRRLPERAWNYEA